MAGTSTGEIARNRAELAAGLRELERVLDAVGADSDKDILDAVGHLAVGNIKGLMSGPSPSQPYEPPGVDTGRARAGWSHEVNVGPVRSELIVGSHVYYDPFLEFGTSKMQPRPHARPGIAMTLPEIPRVAAAVIEHRQRQARRRR